MWVDFPGCTYYPQDCKYIPTSALKAIPANIKDYVLKAASGQTPTGQYVGTLANKGTGIDTFNQWDSKISADTKTELQDITAKIVSGEIDVKKL
jgi:basic membrane protein A